MSHLLFNQFLLSLAYRRKKPLQVQTHTHLFLLFSFFLLHTDLPLKQQVYFLQATHEEVIAEQK